MSDAEQPRRKPRRIAQFGQVLISLQENILRQIQRVFPIPENPEEVIEHTLLVPRYQGVERVNVALPRLDDEIWVFHFPEDQL
jgi:hypothetical protein